ncbi:MAG: hypothetical protein EOP01_11075 [Propionibacteriaceae bacterium]|nr:MAG: hypothetical protein EOP01_11075 [Propionibacteriaceae bacterium]
MVLVVVCALTSVVGHLLGYRLNLTTARVPAPTAASTPEQVVLTYVEAYDDEDWSTMAKIYPGQSFDRFRAIGTMSDVVVVQSRAMDGTEHGNAAKPGVSYYSVRVTLQLSGLEGSESAYTSGPNGWAYELERRGPGEPWHITDQGNP